ncbi:hypothetical protein EUZ87_05140 [Lactiplantibacillus paraplantarum]|uniref:Uncharacterized protein n=1 Tax=Lactiplantibacillus paraplantarum TaxID=60520 RepID=A0A4V2L1W5_9LACO|nr:hypothetical protein EUZ87_05140 [Lactiplantibacillus paraplantarum]
MKQVVINIGNDEYTVNIWGDDLKKLSAERVTGMMLAAAIDRMIESGHSKELVMKIVDDAYESRPQSHNSDIQRVSG